MNPLSSLLSISSILLVFLILNPHGINGDLISDFCKDASKDDPYLKYDFCVASLLANPASRDADLLGLGVISMRMCLENATSIHFYIDHILKDGKGEPAAKQCVKVCSQVYSDALDSIQSAIASFKSKDYDLANMHINSAMNAAFDCERGFTELGQNATSTLIKLDADYVQLTVIPLTITYNLSI
ncbi:hypothetical protein MKX03_036446 [Papaver bracteatum]|nr:hypothetical protein MKX03_036446 [Papaver bracteatum]